MNRILNISGNIEHKKGRQHFRNARTITMVIALRIIHVKVGWRLNLTNKFQDKKRFSNRLATVLFRGTPCRLWLKGLAVDNALIYQRYSWTLVWVKLSKRKSPEFISFQDTKMTTHWYSNKSLKGLVLTIWIEGHLKLR